MHRYSFKREGIVFSYLDAGGPGAPLLALHGHWMGASDFRRLAEDLAPDWRVIALDQCGFGETDHGAEHSLAPYLQDSIRQGPEGWSLAFDPANSLSRNGRPMATTGRHGCRAAAQY